MKTYFNCANGDNPIADIANGNIVFMKVLNMINGNVPYNTNFLVISHVFSAGLNNTVFYVIEPSLEEPSITE